MLHKITCYPLGNADSILVSLDNGRRLLFDYVACRDEADKSDKRIDLPQQLNALFSKNDSKEFDVVAFTHADDDHVHGASDYFYLEHAKKYQGDERPKIKELWVPAAFVLESNLGNDALALRQEARFRLLKGTGVKVFSRPELLKDWLEENKLSIERRAGCLVDAGKIVPGLSLADDGLEVFGHSPFGWRIEDKVEDRNSNGLVVQLTLQTMTRTCKVLMGSDTEWEAWDQIVTTSKRHKNDSRLEWDIFKLSHHCSFTALSADKGKDKTTPTNNIRWLFEQGSERSVMIATCKPIPDDDADSQPPHRQAAAFYKDVATETKGFFKVTMEHPEPRSPQPLVILINDDGATIEKSSLLASSIIVGQSAPRAGYDR
jgi:hypothetical protein